MSLISLLERGRLAFRGHVSVGAVGVIAPMVFEKSHIDAQHLGAAGCAETWVLKQTAHSYFCNSLRPWHLHP